jgi:hypothetical protein
MVEEPKTYKYGYLGIIEGSGFLLLLFRGYEEKLIL